MRHDIISMVRP